MIGTAEMRALVEAAPTVLCPTVLGRLEDNNPHDRR